MAPLYSIAKNIEKKIKEQLKPHFFKIINESDQHAHHAQKPEGSETHFALKIVSDDFEGKSRVERQRYVYQILDEEIKAGVHALSLRLYTPEEASHR